MPRKGLKMLTQEELSRNQGGGSGIPKSMPPTKIKAFLEEFPWIEKLVKKPITQVYVSKVEPLFLNYSPEMLDGDLILSLFFGFKSMCENIYLLDKEGKIIITDAERHRKKYFIFGPIISKIKKFFSVVRQGSTIYSALEELGEKANLVHFIVSYYEYTEAVIVYKLPKGISMLEWIQNEIESDKTKFRNAC